MKVERDRKRKEAQLKEQAKLLEIEAKIQKARERIEQSKTQKSVNAKESRPVNKKQLNEDFADVYSNNEQVETRSKGLPPKQKKRTAEQHSSPEKQINLDNEGSS
jgi:hypothetical protein